MDLPTIMCNDAFKQSFVGVLRTEPNVTNADGGSAEPDNKKVVQHVCERLEAGQTQCVGFNTHFVRSERSKLKPGAYCV